MNILFKKIVSYVIDYLLVTFVLQIYMFCANVFLLESNTINNAILMVISALIALLMLTCYIPTKTNGQTIGQKIMKICVVNLNQRPRNYFENFLRECMIKIVFAPIFIGIVIIYSIVSSLSKKEFDFILAHDHLLKTKVVAVDG